MMKNVLRLLGACMLLLFTLTACGGAGNAAPAGSIPVHITETDFHIATSVTSFVPGKTYHFIVSNQGQTMHEFMIMPRAMGSMNGLSMEEMHLEALASIDMIDPGQTQTLDYTFPASAVGSQLEFACHMMGHYEAGMKLAVTVQA